MKIVYRHIMLTYLLWYFVTLKYFNIAGSTKRIAIESEYNPAIGHLYEK
jgi:UDP-glucose 4-epimerase